MRRTIPVAKHSHRSTQLDNTIRRLLLVNVVCFLSVCVRACVRPRSLRNSMRLVGVGLGLLLAAAIVAIVADPTTATKQFEPSSTRVSALVEPPRATVTRLCELLRKGEPVANTIAAAAETTTDAETTEEPATEFAPELPTPATIELELLVSESLFQVEFRSSQQALYRFCLDVTHHLSGVFGAVSINIKLRAVEVWRRPVSEQTTIALTTLLRYRQMRQLSGPTASDFTVLLVSTPFQHSVVGNSILRGLCTSAYSGTIVSTYKFPVNTTSWAADLADTIAHELGHGLGLDHDDADVVGSGTVMAATASTSSRLRLREWSAPNQDYFLKRRAQLLRNYPCLTTVASAVRRPTQDFASCGNGIVDNGEDCDCGHPLGARCLGPEGACCEPDSCLLRPGAACGVNAECCDLATCQFRTNRTLCRPVAHPECDVPEYCTGQSGHCPPDVVRNTLAPCAYTDDSFTAYSGPIVAARCIRGACRTHTDQCRRLWGPMMMSADLACYDLNGEGTYANNCGRLEAGERRALRRDLTERRRNKTIEALTNMTYPYQFRACSEAHLRCGTIQCQHSQTQLPPNTEGPRPLMGTIVRVQSRYTRQSNLSPVRCIAALIDVGVREPDNPALAPDGATCGPDRVCYRQRCHDVEKLRRILDPAKPTPRTPKPSTATTLQIVTTTTITTKTTVVVTTPKLLPSAAPVEKLDDALPESGPTDTSVTVWKRRTTLAAPSTSVATVIITMVLVVLALLMIAGAVLYVLSAKASAGWANVPTTDHSDRSPPEYEAVASPKITWMM